jgi:hypothetical protein
MSTVMLINIVPNFGMQVREREREILTLQQHETDMFIKQIL